MSKSLLLICLLLLTANAQSNLTVQVPAEYAYLLPRPFNNTFTQPFVDTTVPPGPVNATIIEAHNASFISYDSEFNQILGDAPTVVEIANSDTSFAFEAGVWVPNLNQVVSFANYSRGIVLIVW